VPLFILPLFISPFFSLNLSICIYFYFIYLYFSFDYFVLSSYFVILFHTRRTRFDFLLRYFPPPPPPPPPLSFCLLWVSMSFPTRIDLIYSFSLVILLLFIDEIERQNKKEMYRWNTAVISNMKQELCSSKFARRIEGIKVAIGAA